MVSCTWWTGSTVAKTRSKILDRVLDCEYPKEKYVVVQLLGHGVGISEQLWKLSKTVVRTALYSLGVPLQGRAPLPAKRDGGWFTAEDSDPVKRNCHTRPCEKPRKRPTLLRSEHWEVYLPHLKATRERPVQALLRVTEKEVQDSEERRRVQDNVAQRESTSLLEGGDAT